MVAVRIPGADSIDQVAPARDPGVRADPSDFGADIGASAEHFGNAAVSLAAHLSAKRQSAQDDVYSSTYDVNANPALTQTVIDTKKQFPDGGPGFMEALQANLDKTHQDVTQKLASQGLVPSDTAAATVNKRFNALKADYLVKGVVIANNEKVAGLQTQLGDNVDTIKSSVLAGNMSLDDALKGVETNAASGKGLYSASQLVEQKDKWQQGVIDAAIESKTKAGDLAGAQAIKDKYYGRTPKAGQNIYDAIYAQESGSGRNISTSVTGARGGMQIQPATFKQYAKPGESIDNPADNQAVGRRIIDDLSAKAGGDPARIAVGYFSGPGNIAPPGSPTPWKQDRADPTGKTVSSYVGDVMRRMGKDARGNVKVASADGVVGQAPNADASGDATDASSGDSAPVLPNADKSLYWDKQFHAAQVDQKQRDALRTAQLKQQSDARELEVLKDIHSDNPTIPAREIWNDPQLTLAAKEKLFNVKQATTGGEKADKTYGPGFYKLYQQVHARDDDPNRLTDPASLYSHVGPNGDLTVAGVDKLVSEIQGRKTPEGVSEGEMKSQFFKMAKSQISGSDEGLHIHDPKGDELYLKFMAQALPAYDAGRKAGKSSTQLLNPESPDYIGKSIATFKRPMDQWFSDVVQGGATKAEPAQTFDVNKVNSLDDLVAAYRAGKVPKAVADQLAVDKGWAVRKVPTAAVSVPVSQ